MTRDFVEVQNISALRIYLLKSTLLDSNHTTALNIYTKFKLSPTNINKLSRMCI